MTKPDVLMVGPYPDWEMPQLESDYVVHKLWLAEDRPRFLSEVGPRIRAIATNGVLGADAELINACPRLEIIACFGVGFDAIDLDRARTRGIRVTNTPDVLTEDVADMAFALILASLRRIVEGDAYVRSGAWTKGALPLGRSLNGKRLGILGYGRIGRAIARRASAFGMSVAYCDLAKDPSSPHVYHADPVSLARASDILVAVTAGGAATRNLVGPSVFDALGPEGLFVNVSRGPVVDEPALIAALEQKRIGGAALDVFWNEPNIDRRLLGFANVVLQPHHASGTVETRKAMGKLVRDNLAAHFAGRPLPTPVI
ncbi:MAG TPA: 2-hydroxyacid dehydrogenase [Roseiarcus sp.]|jgi:D-3-phosphoglycerate dehydrogenase|nr:2-hydroxyacid dehydrogenase [Roseiarcus sp.]